MKVEVYKSIDIETEVDVSVEDITQALHDAFESARATVGSEHSCDRTKNFDVTQFIVAVHQCLSAVTDSMIAAVNDKQRAVIANALTKQADRFMPKTVEVQS